MQATQGRHRGMTATNLNEMRGKPTDIGLRDRLPARPRDEIYRHECPPEYACE